MKTGEKLPQIVLPAIDNTEFDSNILRGKKHLITLFRFATCPFCNLRIPQLAKINDELGDRFEVVGIFPSEIEYLKKHTNKHTSGFPILADYEKKYYTLFGVKNSLFGMMRGMIFRMPSLLKSMALGNIPREISSRALIMPLSVLVDERGVIREVYHGKDEGDHISLDTVRNFSKKNF